MKKRILVDLDGICADLLGAWLDRLNANHGRSFTKAEVTNWNIAKALGMAKEEVDAVLDEPGLFRCLPVIPGAPTALEVLQSRGHEVFIVTAPTHSPACVADKVAWARENLPIDPQHIVVTGKKFLVKGDVLIDDAPHQANRYSQHWPQAAIMTIAYPYNIDAASFTHRAEGWENPRQAWTDIVEMIG